MKDTHMYRLTLRIIAIGSQLLLISSSSTAGQYGANCDTGTETPMELATTHTQFMITPEKYNYRFQELECLKGRIDFWVRVYTELGKDYAYVVNRKDMSIRTTIRWYDDTERNKKSRTQLDIKYGKGNYRIQPGIKERFEAGYLTYENELGRVVHEEFRKAGIPKELALLAHVESSYNPNAVSRVKATGLFQIMPFWVKPLGLKSVTDLKDVRITTRSAAKILTQKYDALGSWPMAVTAWNQGGGAMRRAMRNHGDNICDVIANYDGKYFGYSGENFYASFLAVKRIVESRNSKVYNSY